MTDPEPVDSIVPRIMELYTQSPKGWHVLSTPKGDMLIMGPDSSFHLKLIPINPTEFTGVGVEIPGSHKSLDFVRRVPEYGFRPIHDSDLDQILSLLNQGSDAQSVIKSIIQREPMTPTAIEHSDARHILTGPVLTRPNLGDISSEISKVHSSLEREALELFRKKYPMRAGMFF